MTKWQIFNIVKKDLKKRKKNAILNKVEWFRIYMNNHEDEDEIYTVEQITKIAKEYYDLISAYDRYYDDQIKAWKKAIYSKK